MVRDTIYTEMMPEGKTEVYDTIFEGEPIRFLSVDGHMQSAMYLDEEKKYDLLFPYMQRFSYAFACNPDIRKTLLIGGGTFSYPKYYLEHYRHSHITVVEINKNLIDLSYRYFRLDELDIEQQSNLKIICDDAFDWLAKTDEKFDWIINDAFLGNLMQGREEKYMELIREHLNEDGIYMENHVSAAKGPLSASLRKRRKVMEKYFISVSAMVCEEDMHPWEKQNILLTAMDHEE